MTPPILLAAANFSTERLTDEAEFLFVLLSVAGQKLSSRIDRLRGPGMYTVFPTLKDMEIIANLSLA